MNKYARQCLIKDRYLTEIKKEKYKNTNDFVDDLLEKLHLSFIENFEISIMNNKLTSFYSQDNDLYIFRFKNFIIAEFKLIDNYDIDNHRNNKKQTVLSDFIIYPIFYIDYQKDIYYYSQKRKHRPLMPLEIFDIIIDTVKDISQIYDNSNIKTDLINYIKDNLSNFKLKNQVKINILINKLKPEDLRFNDLLELSFSKSIEQDIHDYLLTKPIDWVGRYMSLESFFKTIDEQKIYFGSIVGMNDKSEVDYYEKNIYANSTFFDNCTKKEIQKINRAFITSYVKENKIDDLTMWRLYGDDGKGICLVFSVNEHYENQEYYLREISYGSDDNSHEEVKFLNQFTNFLSESKQQDVNVSSFIFNQSYIWKYFFKSKHYSVEEEVRLLYYNENNVIKPVWRLSNDIIVPSVFINFKDLSLDFPLLLIGVIIGPKALEGEINKKQIEHFMEEKGYSDRFVTLSQIDNYR